MFRNVSILAKSNASDALNLGNLGRSSIADLTISGVTTDAAARKVSVNSSAVLQPISAEVLEGFVKVYQAYYEAGFYIEYCALATLNNCESAEEQATAKAAAKKAAEERVAKDHITAGNPLGTFAFTAQTQ